MKKIFNLAVLLCVLGIVSARSQTAAPPPMPAYQPLSDEQMNQLLGPIALYPDPLIAQILPAATLPTQIVLADRYISGGGDPNQIDQQPWDASVQALARYPDVLKWMDDNLNWTTELGQAFLNQQPDVMESIQRLRQSAQNNGNLQSTPQQQVVDDNGDIEILPAEPQVIYVPVYQPDTIYYQSGCPLSFGIGFAIGGWLNCDFDWQNHHLVYWNRDHPRPANWWHEQPAQRNAWIARQATVWRPMNHENTSLIIRGDRGYQPVAHSPAPVSYRTESHPQEPHNNVTVITIPGHGATPPPAAIPRSQAIPVQHYQTISRPTSTGAFIGIQSSQETRTYSNRGQQSMQTVNHSAPASRSAPASGGGSHGGGSKPQR
jgi:Protein of unknown function (DUF3300)